MTHVRTFVIAAATFAAPIFATADGAGASELSTLLDSFAILAASTITNTGASTIDGNVGLYAGTSIVGFDSAGANSVTLIPPSQIHDTDATAQQAQSDLSSAFTTLMGLPFDSNLSGQDLANKVLTAGVYFYSSSAALTSGTLTLNAEGNPNAVFVIQVTSELDVTNGTVLLINGAQGKNVYWVVGSSAILGTGVDFAGEILAYASINLDTGATITCGAALVETAEVTLDSNTISAHCAFAGFGTTLGSTSTGNEQAVAAALDTFVTNGGTLPAEFLPLLNGPTAEELAAALTQLAGEAGTAAAPAATEAMNSFMSQLFDSTFEETAGRPGAAPGPSTVKTLGYASERTPSPGPAAALAPLNSSVDPNRWGSWASGYGGYSMTAGDASVGSHDRSATIFGVSAGFDQRITAATTVGVAFGAGHTNFGLSDGFGGGNDAMLQAALYARTNLEHAYIAGAVAYAYNDVSTDRNMTTPVVDHFSAAFVGHDVAGEIEAGYRMAWFIPYAAARAQAFFSPAYGETADSVPSPFALNYAAQTTTALRTELGARIERTFGIANGETLSLRARAAWAHDFGASPYMIAALQSIPSATFTVQGAAAARDSILLSAGAELGFANGFALGGSFDSEFAENSQTYSGTGRVSYHW